MKQPVHPSPDPWVCDEALGAIFAADGSTVVTTPGIQVLPVDAANLRFICEAANEKAVRDRRKAQKEQLLEGRMRP